MKYLLLVLLPGFVTTIQEIFPVGPGSETDEEMHNDLHHFQRLIPANLRQGNRYNIEVDNIGSQIIYKGVAVLSVISVTLC